MIKIACPAKINLTLKVLDKRPDGFHNIDSVMQTIDLFDYLTISAENGCGITLTGTSSEIPYDEKNLVYKATELFLNVVKRQAAVNIRIEKNIPVAAGLAGGSTDAAGTLCGLNKLCGKPLSAAQLHELCSKLGADVNFCLTGGRARARGRGEILTPLDFEEFSVSLIKPLDLGISAKEAYDRFAAGYIGNFANDLEPALLKIYPQLQKIKELYPEAVMSGSGSTYFMLGKEFQPLNNYWISGEHKAVPCGVRELL